MVAGTVTAFSLSFFCHEHYGFALSFNKTSIQRKSGRNIRSVVLADRFLTKLASPLTPNSVNHAFFLVSTFLDYIADESFNESLISVLSSMTLVETLLLETLLNSVLGYNVCIHVYVTVRL